MKKNSLYGVVGVLFVISGALGLIYQIVWFKYISFFLGNTTYAQTIVVATFMGGLAIGATLWGNRADRAKNPLTLYAWLELGIGTYCFLYPLFLDLLKRAFVGIVLSLQLPSDGSAVLILKLFTSLLTLLPPTILMGGTLPVLVRFISERIEDAGKNVATLYFLNSFGAVVGSILGGFFFVSMLGLQMTIYTGATLNILVGVAGLMLGTVEFRSIDEKQQESQSSHSSYSPRARNTAILVAGISGFASMIYEVGWVRLFIPVLGSSIYSFTLMLVGFISGITIGSYIVYSSVERIKNLFGFLAVCQLGIVLSMVVVLPLYGRIPYYFWVVAHALNRSEMTYPIFLGVEFLFGFLIMIVPTIFLGMSLPAASRIASTSLKILGKSIGNIFSVNTIGTVIGSIVAGLVLIPLVGVKQTIETAVLINLALGLYVLAADNGFRKVPKYVGAGTVVMVTMAYFVFGTDWNRSVALSPVFRQINRNTAPPSTYASFEAFSRVRNVLYYKEGASATVAVLESESPLGKQNVLYINGKADASSVMDLPTQVLLGQLPSLLHPNLQSALVVGLGSGVTVGSILTYPVKKVDCIEISPEVVEAVHHFDSVNHKPLQDPRTKVYIEDALAYLKLSAEKYDIIVSEPSNPWIAGIGSLYTVEFFREAKKKLNKGGIMVQWFHLYEMDDETFKLVLRTFQASFKHVSVWHSLYPDAILLGTDEPIELNYSTLQNKMLLPGVREDMKRINIGYPTTLMSLQALSTERVRDYCGTGPVNTEDRPLLEYWAPQTFFVNRGVTELTKYDERLKVVGGSVLLKTFLNDHELTDEQLLEIGELHSSGQRGYPPLGYSILSEYCARQPSDHDALDKLADIADRLKNTDEAICYRKILAEKEPNRVEYLEKYATLKFSRDRNYVNLISGYKTDEIERLLTKCINLSADTVDRYRVKLADMYFIVQDYRKATNNYMRALQIREKHQPDSRLSQDGLLVQLAKCLNFAGIRDRAAGYALQATWINPDNQEAKDFIYEMWMRGEKVKSDSTGPAMK